MTTLLKTFIGSLLVSQLGGIVPSMQAHQFLPGAKVVQVYHSYHALFLTPQLQITPLSEGDVH